MKRATRISPVHAGENAPFYRKKQGGVKTMKKFGKILCAILGICFAFSMACACDTDKKGGSAITLVVWAPTEDMAFAKSVANDFQTANPDKKFKFQWAEQSEKDAATKLLNDVENGADVFSFANDQLNRLIVGDGIAQIAGSRLERMKAANTVDSIDAATVTVKGEDKTFAYPYTDNTFFLYYNKSVFNETDIQTLDGILAKCDAEHQFAYPINDGWYGTAFFFGKELGYEVTYSDKLAETKVTIDFGNEVGLNVAKSMFKYVQNPGFKGDSDDSKITAGFNSGSVVAGVTGIWNKSKIQEYLGDNFGVAKLPTYTYYDANNTSEQVQLVSFAGYKLLGVRKGAPVEAYDFAEFYTNKQNQLKHFEARGFLPTNKEAQTDSRIVADDCAKAIAAQLQHSKTQKGVPTAIYSAWEGVGNNMINNKAGTFDAEQQMAAFIKAVAKE